MRRLRSKADTIEEAKEQAAEESHFMVADYCEADEIGEEERP